MKEALSIGIFSAASVLIFFLLIVLAVFRGEYRIGRVSRFVENKVNRLEEIPEVFWPGFGLIIFFGLVMIGIAVYVLLGPSGPIAH